MNKIFLRKLAGFMAILLAANIGPAPIPVAVNEVHASESDKKTITGLGTGAITNPDQNTPGSWCYVYYGHETNDEYANNNGALFRVLQKDTTEFSKEDKDGNKIEPLTHTMFLDSNKLFAKMPFNVNENNTEWKESNPYKWLNEDDDGFYNSSTYLTDAEKAAITESYKKDSPVNRDDYRSLTGEKVFILDESDVICSAYGYYDYQGKHESNKKSYITGGDPQAWWLRTSAQDLEVKVTSEGNSYGFGDVVYDAGVSPAFNLDLSSILFSTCVAGEAGSTGARYKLTIKDDDYRITVSSAQIHDNTVTVPYQVSGNGVNRISVLLIDSEYTPGKTLSCTSDEPGAIPHVTYLKLDTEDSPENGTGSFELPAEYAHLKCGGDYHAYLVAERVSSYYDTTDYASKPVEIDIPKGPEDTCDHEFEYTLKGDRIIASCKKDDCWYHEKGIRVGMKLPEELAYEEGTAREASVTGYPSATIRNLAEKPIISYFRSMGFGSTEPEDDTSVPPNTPGEYVAVMTWGGLSVKKAFSIIDVKKQGTEGANIRWYLDNNGVLTIAGTGAIRDYNSASNTPWYDQVVKIKSIHILNGISGIGKYAFNGLTMTESISLPEGLKNIGDYAFADLGKNQSIILPEGLKSIGNEAFRKNTPETITIPKSVSHIGAGAFLCNTIKEIVVEEGSEDYKIEDGVLLTKDGKELVKYPPATAATSYIVPDTVEKICLGAFAGSTKLSDIDLPRGLKWIDDRAFHSTSIKKLDIPDGVEHIGTCIFEELSLQEVIIPRTAYLETFAFLYADKVEKIKYVGTPSEWDSLKLKRDINTSLSSNSVQCNYRESISNYTMDRIAALEYTGEPLTPKVTLRNPRTGKALIENTDYTVEYSDNTKCGTAKVVASGNSVLPGSKSRYKGSVTGQFRIVESSGEEPPEEKSYTVSFNMCGHGEAIEPQKVEEGKTAVRPADPEDEDYEFEGWYTTESFDALYDFSAPVDKDTELFAKWTRKISPMNPVMVIDDDTTQLHLVKGQKFTLPEGEWTSSDKKFVSIAKKTGLLAAKKETTDGSVTLTRAGSDKAIKVYITNPMLEKKKSMNAGSEPATLKLGYDNEHLKVQWYSNNPDIATVSGNGQVTAVSKGKAVITAYINGKAYTGSIAVKETAPAKQRTLHLNAGSSKALKVKGVKSWNVADESIAGVNKLKITGLKAGCTTLSGNGADGKTYTVAVTVEDIGIKTGKIVSAGKNKYAVELKPGEKAKIEFNDVKQFVVFKSSNGDKAYVDKDLNIVANHEGEATLTAKLNGKPVRIKAVVKK